MTTQKAKKKTQGQVRMTWETQKQTSASVLDRELCKERKTPLENQGLEIKKWTILLCWNTIPRGKLDRARGWSHRSPVTCLVPATSSCLRSTTLTTQKNLQTGCSARKKEERFRSPTRKTLDQELKNTKNTLEICLLMPETNEIWKNFLMFSCLIQRQVIQYHHLGRVNKLVTSSYENRHS